MASNDGGTTTKHFIGLPDGSLRWDDKHIVRSVNGVGAGPVGNVSISYNDLSNRPSITNPQDTIRSTGTPIGVTIRSDGSWTSTNNGVMIAISSTLKEVRVNGVRIRGDGSAGSVTSNNCWFYVKAGDLITISNGGYDSQYLQLFPTV